jgi:hypothetical protein
VVKRSGATMAEQRPLGAVQGVAWIKFKRFARRLYIVLSTVGLFACAVAIVANLNGWLDVSWRNPTVDSAALMIWSWLHWGALNSGEIVRVISFALLAWALFVAAMKIDTVFNIVSTFNEARSPISELRSSVDGVKGTAREFASNMDALREASAILNRHAPTLSELNERLAALSDQVIGLQEETISQRTGEVAVTPAVAPDAARGGASDEENWEELRSIWRRNNQRLEFTISEKLHGARQRSYARMPRTDYPSIIDRLKQHNVLSIAAHKASRELHEIFMSYKPRNRAIPDSVIGDMRNLDHQLEQLIGVVKVPATLSPGPDDDRGSSNDSGPPHDPLLSPSAESPPRDSPIGASAGGIDDGTSRKTRT